MRFEPFSLAKVQEQLAQVAAYDLPEGFGTTGASETRTRSLRAAEAGITPDAAVVSNGVVSFVSGMREENKADVRNSYLYASLVASKQYPKSEDGEKWYELFATVMNQLGWTFVDKSYTRFSSSDVSLTMDKIGLQMIASAVASAALPAAIGPALLKVAGTALEGMKDPANAKPFSLFKRHSDKDGGGQYTLASCAEDEEGEVIMAFGAVHDQHDNNDGNILFVGWNSGSKDTFSGNARVVLNPMVYAMARELVLERLGQNVQSAIASYDI